MKDIQVIIVAYNVHELEDGFPAETIVTDEKLAYVLIHSDIKTFSVSDNHWFEDMICEVEEKWYLPNHGLFVKTKVNV